MSITKETITRVMVYIEPIQLEISTAGEQLSPTLRDDEQLEVPGWPEIFNWALNKILNNSCKKISRKDINETIESSLENLYSPISDVEKEFTEFLKRRAMRGIRRAPDTVVFYEDNVVILPSDHQGQLYIIGEYKQEVRSIISSFKERIANFSNIASDFGLEVKILSGNEFAESMSNLLDAEVVSREDFDNTAEEAVYSEITERLTKSIDSNITLRFGKDDPEVFEYDLLLHAGENNRFVIEIKDASREEANLEKNDLIDTPRDKTNILKSGKETSSFPYVNRERNEIFVIVKHMDEEKFKDQKQMAERREINLLRYEDGGYIEKLDEKFRGMVNSEM